MLAISGLKDALELAAGTSAALAPALMAAADSARGCWTSSTSIRSNLAPSSRQSQVAGAARRGAPLRPSSPPRPRRHRTRCCGQVRRPGPAEVAQAFDKAAAAAAAAAASVGGDAAAGRCRRWRGRAGRWWRAAWGCCCGGWEQRSSSGSWWCRETFRATPLSAARHIAVATALSLHQLRLTLANNNSLNGDALAGDCDRGGRR